MTRNARIAAYVLGGFAAALLLLVLAVVVLTRTEWGVRQVGELAVEQLRQRVGGELRVGRVTSGGLLGGVTLHDVEIDDPQAAPFLRIDSVRLSYDWRNLLGGSIVFDDATVWDPHVYLVKLPGDSLWNYEYVFPDTTPEDQASADQLILIEDARVVNGRVEIRTPWEPDEPVASGEPERVIVEDVPGRGAVRVVRFEDIDAVLPRILWSSPEESGKFFRIAEGSTVGYWYETPFRLTDVRGSVGVRDSLITIDAPQLRLPESRASLLGQVVLGEEDNSFDLLIRSDAFTFADLQWIYPDLPEEGGGEMELRLQTRPEGLLWLAQDAHIRAPGTELRGTLGFVTGEDPYFTRVSLRASPIDLDLIERLLPGDLPVEGLMIGTVEVEGPISSLDTRGDVQLSGSADGEWSGLAWRGTVDLSRRSVRSLHANVRGLDLALLRALGSGVPLNGRVTGSMNAQGRADGSVRFAADLTHALAGRPDSRLSGNGDWRPGGAAGAAMEIELEAEPLALELLADAFPALDRLTGEARGPIRIRGGRQDLRLAADLTTRYGPFALAATFDLSAQRPAYSAVATLAGLRLGELIPALPTAALHGRVEVEGSGAGLEAAEARWSAVIDSLAMAGGTLGPGRAAGRLTGGLLEVDSARVDLGPGLLLADGALGLRAGRSGLLNLRVENGSLVPFAAWLTPDPAGGAATTVAGRMSARATLEGSVAAAALRAEAELDDVAIENVTAGSLRLGLRADGLGGQAPQLRVEAAADRLSLNGRAVASATLGGEYRYPDGHVRLSGRTADGLGLELTSGLRRVSAGLELQLERLDATADGARWALGSPARVRAGRDGLAVEGFALERAETGGRVSAEGWLPWRRPSDPSAEPVGFRVEAADVPIAEWLRFADPEPAVDGSLSALFDVRGSAASPAINGTLHVLSLRLREAELDRLQSGFAYADRRLEAKVQGLHGGRRVLVGEGRIPIDLSLQPEAGRHVDQPMSFVLTADSLPASVPLGFFDGIEDVRGRIDGSISVTGHTTEPVLGGTLTLRDGEASWVPSGVRYGGVQAEFRLLEGGAVRVEANGRAGDGRATVAGSLRFTRLSDPEFDLSLRAAAFPLAARRDVEAVGGGELRLLGRYTSPRVTGSVAVGPGTLYLDEVWRRYLIVQLADPFLLDILQTDTARAPRLANGASPFLQNLVVENATIDVGRDVWLRSREMNVEVQGQLAVDFDRRARDLRLSGDLRAVRGSYQVYGRRFEVREGSVEFVGTPGIDPGLDILASYPTMAGASGPREIQARVSGTLQRPRVKLSSDIEPPISESDLASYLLFGRPTSELAAGERGALAVRTELADLGRGLLLPSFYGLASRGLESVAEGFGLDYFALSSAAAADSAATSVLDPLGLFGTTQVEIGRYLTPDLFFSVTQRLGGAEYHDPGVRLEWRVTPTVSTEAFWEDRYARTFSLGPDGALQRRRVLGFFLFREWNF